MQPNVSAEKVSIIEICYLTHCTTIRGNSPSVKSSTKKISTDVQVWDKISAILAAVFNTCF